MIFTFRRRHIGRVAAHFSAILAIFFSLMWHANRVEAAELVMFESAGCEWCELWDEEIGVIYAKTREAGLLPLRRVEIEGERPVDLQQIKGLVYTPTFIVLEDGQEMGRIIGYPGEPYFWQLLNEIIGKLTTKTDLTN